MPPPQLRLGLVGFADESYLGNLMRTRRSVAWQPWTAMDADALWINGAHAQPGRNHVVRIPSGRPEEAATLLSLKDLDRPAAFALPLGNGYFAPPEVFDPHSARSVAEVLQGFETRLRPLASQLALAQEIAGRRYQLTSPVYHLTSGGTLLAVVDVAGNVGIDPAVGPDDLAQAEWHGRPGAAGAIPGHFAGLGMAQLMWQYAMRSADDLLPEKYRRSAIYFRRAPYVPRGLLKDVHLALLAEISTRPYTFKELQQEIGLGDQALAQALGALYFAGSITTDAARASLKPRSLDGRAREGEPSMASVASGFSLPSLPEPQSARRALDTVPTPLEMPRGRT